MSKPREPKYCTVHIWPWTEKKHTYTHLLCTNAWLRDFSPSLWNFPPIQHLRKRGDPTQRQINSCTLLPTMVSSSSADNCMRTATNKHTSAGDAVALHLASAHTFGTRADSPSFPWSLAASTQLLQGCPTIISVLGKDLRSTTVAIAVEPSPRWIGCCCCFSCCLAARRCSPLTSSSALSDILSATM